MKLLGKIEHAQDAVSKEYVDGLVEHGGGGVSQEDFDALYDGLVEAEEVAAAAMNDLNLRLGELAENVKGETVTKSEFEAAIGGLNGTLSGKADGPATLAALTSLSEQIQTLSGQVASAATSDQLSSAVESVNRIIVENEEITAAALNDLNTRVAALGATAIQSVKTINGQSIVGEGDITIEGSGVSEEYVDNAIASAITNTLNTAV